MDNNHPIPQDVTGFQFRLIGDMTVKQFAYIAAAGIVVIAFFYLPFPIYIQLPVAIFFGGMGAALAFLPVEGRPLDVMSGYFLKALVTPNQYAYHKVGGELALFTMQSAPKHSQEAHQPPDVAKTQQLQTYLQSIHGKNASLLDEKEAQFLHGIFDPQVVAIQHPTAPQPANEVRKPEDASEENIEEQEANLSLQAATVKHELSEAKEQEAKEKDQTKQQALHGHVAELEHKLATIIAQKEVLEKEIEALKQKKEALTKPAPEAPQAQPEPTQTHEAQPAAPTQPAEPSQAPTQAETPTQEATQQPEEPQQQEQAQPQGEPSVRRIPATMAKSIGLPRMPEVPNLIVGLVKDPRDNVLQNILVEVKDKDGIPARAFRTNTLGQFASATPLANGTYTIEFEDPKKTHRFDSIEIEAKGEIMLPLEITSHDDREDLRRELFNA